MAQQWPVTTPSLAGFTKVPPGTRIHTPHFVAIVSPITGGLSSLVPLPTSTVDAAGLVLGQDWVSAAGKYDLFQFVYRSMNQKHDFTPFRNNFTGARAWSSGRHALG